MFARLSKLLSLRQRQSCLAALNELYCHLSVVLMRQNAQALLAHAAGARSILCIYYFFVYSLYPLSIFFIILAY